ncbi:MAG: hypothetical protein WC868_13185 [Bacteroidales bacterium]
MKKIMIKFLFWAMISGTITSTFAQGVQPLRVEIEAKKSSDDYNVVPVGKDGVILFYESYEKEKGDKIWVFTKYNTELKEDWNEEVPVQKSLDFIKYYIDDEKMLYVLLGNMHYVAGQSSELISNNASGTFQIVSIDISNGNSNIINSKFPGSLYIRDFKVINDKASIFCMTSPTKGDACMQMFLTCTCIPAFTGLTVFKFHSLIMNVNLNNGTFTTIPIKYEGNTLLLDSDIMKDTNTFYKVFVKNKPNVKTTSNYLIDYSGNGDLIKTSKIKSGSGKLLRTFKYQNLGSEESVIIGTYDTEKKKGFTFNPANNESMGLNSVSEGIYFTKMKGEEQKFIKFYPFSKMENFFKYLKNKTANKVKEKVKKTEKKGKELNVNYNLLVHKIIEKNGQYILIGEAYYPEYRKDSYKTITRDASGVQTGSTTTYTYVFIGYRFTHAVIAAFDSEGNKLWDNSFAIQDILTFNLKEKVKVMFDGDDIILTYSYGGYIKSQIIQGDKIVQGKEDTKIETSLEGDKVKQNWNSDMDFWYDNYFLSWGYQKIKNKGKRTVFYFNKIGLQ